MKSIGFSLPKPLPPTTENWSGTDNPRSFVKTIEDSPKVSSQVSGVASFHLCDDKTFCDVFDALNQHHGILLLDIEIKALGTKMLEGDLRIKANSFLKGLPPTECQVLVTIITAMMNPFKVRSSLDPKRDRHVDRGALAGARGFSRPEKQRLA